VPLDGLIAALSRARTFEKALEAPTRSADFSLVDGLRAPLIAGLLTRKGGPRALLAIVATGRESEALRRSLAAYLPGAQIVEFPAWETLPHERLSPSAETVGKRIAALRGIRDWAKGKQQVPFVLVASVRAALQPLADNLTTVEPIALKAGQRGYDLADLSKKLVDLAYARVDMVTRRGEFAVRGGILDVFAPTDEHPLRLEFFGDELEQVRAFSVADQRSLPTEITEAELPPSRELLLSEAVRQRAREMQHEFPSLSTMLAKIGEGIPVDGMESLAPALVDRLVPLTHYLPADAAIAVLSPERVATRAVNLSETNREFLAAAWNAATAGAEAPIDLDAGDFVTLNVLRASAGSRPWWTMSSFDSGEIVPEELEATGLESYVRIDGTAVPSFAGQPDGALGHVADLLRDGWTVAVTAEGAGLVERAADVLAEHEVSGRAVEAYPVDAEAGVAYLVRASLDVGFELPDAKLAVLSEAEFFGRAAGYDSRQVKRLASRRKNVVDPLQLKSGDFVVHQTHGIGRFVELVQREVSTGGRNAIKTQREFLVIEYAPNKRGYPADKLYVPTDQLDLLTRYVGGEAPALSKMGGSDWAAAKGKARKAVRDIAVELVKLYSARMASRGHAFGPDTP
jgi:transcription-repair coupling factor (superfamily II helicase)